MNSHSYIDGRPDARSTNAVGTEAGGSHDRSGSEDACWVHYVDEEAVSEVETALEALGHDEGVSTAVSAIADPTRLRMLLALAVRPLCVCDIAQVAGISQSGASHQLRVLREAGLVTFERDGRRAVYSLSDPRVVAALDAIQQLGGIAPGCKKEMED